ncbi:hypothetical protein K7X08_026704 [Anisodus acutangulus]|uniref:Uncharacterized protein n=1 Tax=Anisodus acutangulus TaxID=402998 RepID=A0A9Q1LBA3_9SOLA|nr:hypothetical protein K7X08_026704 [Anisodus acutangulus]
MKPLKKKFLVMNKYKKKKKKKRRRIKMLLLKGLVDKIIDDDDGVGGGVSGYTPFGGGGQTTDIPYRLGRYSSVGASTSKVPSCACECSTFKQKMNDLIKKVEEWTQVQKDTNLLLQKFISKRDVNPSNKLTSPYTPIGIRKRANTIFKVLSDCRARKSATSQKSIATLMAEVGSIVLKR